MTLSNAPLATTKMVDDVFRSLNPSSTGLTFGAGLTPFAMVCEGHQEMAAVSKLIKQAELAEAGTSMSLADADRLTSSDVRFPTNAQTAAEKLWAWSIMVDIFHGVSHEIAMSVRRFVIAVGPALHRIAEQSAENPAIGMDLVCRVLYEAQQDYFVYLAALAPSPVGVVCPTFNHIENKVLTYRAGSLAPLPASWYAMLDAPKTVRTRNDTSSSSVSPRSQVGAAPTFNQNPDARLLHRFSESGHSTISSMMNGHEVAIPKIGGKPVCLVWALKGECSSSCKRKAQHKTYPRTVVNDIHGLMDTCGVANPQE